MAATDAKSKSKKAAEHPSVSVVFALDARADANAIVDPQYESMIVGKSLETAYRTLDGPHSRFATTHV